MRPWSGTFADIELVARRLAAGLRERGVEAGDVVALQLPNWMEAAAAFWAASFLGAVVVPVVHLQRLKSQGLWWRVEGQSRLAEESVDEAGPALDGPEPGADYGLELVEGGGGVVAQAAFHR